LSHQLLIQPRQSLHVRLSLPQHLSACCRSSRASQQLGNAGATCWRTAAGWPLSVGAQPVARPQRRMVRAALHGSSTGLYLRVKALERPRHGTAIVSWLDNAI
jgi:hypothetical protein